MPAITPLQLRLARTALRLGVRELAQAAEVSPATIMRFESERTGMQTGTLARVEAALAARGVIFVPAEPGGSATIRVREDPA